jgi:hypothetical protein
MYLVEILLPLTDADKRAFPPERFEGLARTLTEKFGGMTSFTRTPAEGRWKTGASTEHDDIAVIEVMTESIDKRWWKNLRQRLEQDFNQAEIIIRCHKIEKI